MMGLDFQPGLLIGFGFLVVCELILRLSVNRLRNEFQWLITHSRDELPVFKPEVIKKFFDRSFHPLLGWSPKAGSAGFEKGVTGEVQYHIDENGSRRVACKPARRARIATFGDSYTFGRQVADHETWQSELGRLTDSGVLNYGVGNYGLDQAVLKYENTLLPKSIRVVIIGVVPETLCRIHSYWKHYLEFGNILAFKPRFLLVKGELSLLKSPIQSEADIERLKKFLPSIQDNDFFYRRKFRSYQFRGSYFLSFLRHPIYNFRLLSNLLIYKFRKILGAESHRAFNASFQIIMQKNIATSHQMYSEPLSYKLLSEIIKRFKDGATARGHIPILLVMPQKLDLEKVKRGDFPYTSFYENMAGMVDVIDISSSMRNQNTSSLYVEDLYGGHYSAQGNQVVANKIEQYVITHYPHLYSD